MAMALGYDKPLYILAFDQRGSFERDLFAASRRRHVGKLQPVLPSRRRGGNLAHRPAFAGCAAPG
jgi:hypothetical protein